MKSRFGIPIVLALTGSLVATQAFAQAPPAPGAAPPPAPAAGAPPPPGPAVILDRGPGGTVHVDVRCTGTDTTSACVDIATRLFAKLNGDASAK